MGVAETGIGGALGRPAVETATVRGPVGGLLWRTAAGGALGREGK